MTIDMPRVIPAGRLELRAVTVDDAEAQHEAVNESLAELMAWMPWCTGVQPLERSRKNLEQAVEDFEARAGFEYALWVDGTFAGRIGVHAVDLRVPKGEIGYWTRSSCAGRGYMQEAVRALTGTLLELGFARVEIRCDAMNAASARVAEASGYRLDARLVNDDVSRTDPTQLRDTLVWSVTADRG